MFFVSNLLTDLSGNYPLIRIAFWWHRDAILHPMLTPTPRPIPSQPSCQDKATGERSTASDLIPPEWILPSTVLERVRTAQNINVLDIPRTCGLLTPEQIAITESYNAHELLELLAAGTLTSVQVTAAFSKRAAIAQQLTACLAETFFPEALQRAAELDAHLSTTGRPKGPLHGLPISINDSFSVAGVPMILGLVSCLDHSTLEHSSALAQMLLDAGAVLYVKTNMLQAPMTADSNNGVFGCTLNPHKLTLGAGGSSGGEAALIALRGSLLGVGTDIAGSLRIPALCCGTVGFKPSVDRFSNGDETSSRRRGVPGIKACAGPLALSVRDAGLLLKVLLSSNPLASTPLAVPWRDLELAETESKLRIGVIIEDPALPLQPPMLRVMTKATQKLKDAGHELIDISAEARLTYDTNLMVFRYFLLDPGRPALGNLASSSGLQEPSLLAAYQVPGTIQEPSMDELSDLNLARYLAKAKMRDIWIMQKLDVIICPGYQGSAQPHNTSCNGIYSILWNLLEVCRLGSLRMSRYRG